MVPQNANYRPDIDGLRAVAVLGVLFYHVGFSAFGGGFVGVDVFFVISGFLITRLICAEVEETGTFVFSRFYLRRVRRLFPALFFTLFVTAIAASIWFLPADMERFGGALVHAAASLSNFFFWSESGYFDADSHIKPLLHTWSLSVEEQYYLFWPAFLVLLLTRMQKPWVLVTLIGAGVLSFLLNLEVASNDSRLLNQYFPFSSGWFSEAQASIFFLTPFRIFEFVIGAVLVWAVRKRPDSWILHDVLTLLGLAMILFAVLTYTAETLFPSYNAIIPCIGTALLIYSGDKARIFGFLLRNRLAVGVGLISYSLYLIHWPIFVFYQYRKFEPIGLAEGIGICVVSLICAIVMYFLIEKPLRRPKDRKSPAVAGGTFAAICLGFVAFGMYAGSSMWANNGWPWRFGALQDWEILDVAKLQQETVDYNNLNVRMSHFDTGGTKVLVVGDSHARDVSNGLSRVLRGTFEVKMTHVEEQCWPLASEPASAWKGTSCEKSLPQLLQADTIKRADIVVIANWYTADQLDGVEDFLSLLRASNDHKNALKIVFMGRSVGFTSTFHKEALTLLKKGVSTDEINALAFERYYKSAARQDELSKNAFSSIPDVTYVSRVETLCHDARCKFFLDERRLMVWDGSHLTLRGEEEVAKRVLEKHPELFRN